MNLIKVSFSTHRFLQTTNSRQNTCQVLSNYAIVMHRVFFIRHAASRGMGGERKGGRAMMTLQLISITRFSIKDPGRALPRPQAPRCSATRWKSAILSRSVAEALVKGSTLHLHPPGVIYRVHGKMNGRIKKARALVWPKRWR